MKLLKRIIIPSAVALIGVGAVYAESTPIGSDEFESQLAAAKAQSDNPESVALHGLTVFIDKETGEFRPPTAEEAAALSAEMNGPLTAADAPAARSTSAQTFRTANGAVGARLDASHMAYTMATVGPDGKITQTCVHGEEEAKEHLHNHVATAEEK